MPPWGAHGLQRADSTSRRTGPWSHGWAPGGRRAGAQGHIPGWRQPTAPPLSCRGRRTPHAPPPGRAAFRAAGRRVHLVVRRCSRAASRPRQSRAAGAGAGPWAAAAAGRLPARGTRRAGPRGGPPSPCSQWAALWKEPAPSPRKHTPCPGSLQSPPSLAEPRAQLPKEPPSSRETRGAGSGGRTQPRTLPSPQNPPAAAEHLPRGRHLALLLCQDDLQAPVPEPPPLVPGPSSCCRWLPRAHVCPVPCVP